PEGTMLTALLCVLVVYSLVRLSSLRERLDQQASIITALRDRVAALGGVPEAKAEPVGTPSAAPAAAASPTERVAPPTSPAPPPHAPRPSAAPPPPPAIPDPPPPPPPPGPPPPRPAPPPRAGGPRPKVRRADAAPAGPAGDLPRGAHRSGLAAQPRARAPRH